MKIPDTITAKVREFREKFARIVAGQGGFIVGEKGSKFDNCASDLGSIETFLEQALEEVLAEERERVRGVIEELKKNPKRDIVYCSSYELALNDLLSSLDNPDKE